MRRFQNEQELLNLTPPDYYKVDLQESLDSLQNKKAHITVLNEANELLLHAPLILLLMHRTLGQTIHLNYVLFTQENRCNQCS